MAIKSTLTTMSLTLFLVCFFASAIMGGAYALTKDKLEAASNDKIVGAIAGVIPAFDNNPYNDRFTQEYNGKVYTVYPGKKGKEINGYAIESASEGYSGFVSLMIGFIPDGSINDITVLSHTETPGLGDKIEPAKGDFGIQFKGKNPADFKIRVKQDGGDVDAITGVTITSKAYCDAVTNAWEVLKLAKKQ